MWVVWGHHLARPERKASQCEVPYTFRWGVSEEQSQGCLLPTGSQVLLRLQEKDKPKGGARKAEGIIVEKTRGRGSFTWLELKQEAVSSHPHVGKTDKTDRPASS